MNRVWLIMKVTYQEGVRSRVLFGITFLAVFLFAFSLMFARLFAFELGKVMVDISFSALSLAGLSVIFFLAIGLLSRDIHQKTVYMVLGRPVTRGQYLMGKFGGLSLLLLTVMAILGALAFATFLLGAVFIQGIALPRDFSWVTLLTTMSFQFLSLLVVLSFAFFFTTISSSMYLSMLFTLCVYVIGHSLETVLKVLLKGEFVRASASFVSLMKAVSWIFPNLSAFDLKATLSYGLPQEPLYLLWTGIYGCAYAVVMLFLTLIVFQRKDIC